MTDKHIGYKKCQKGLIIVLEILGENNENRENIVDKNHAKMRCSEAKVLQIYNMINNMHTKLIEYKGAFGIYDKFFRYEIGQIVKVDDFDMNLNEVCSTGIHYFLTKESAYFYEYEPKNGIYKEWYDNGQLWKRRTYKDGHLDGLYESWHNNGKICVRCTYKDGKKYGLYESWFDNGRINEKYIYKDRKYDGPYEKWYWTGQIKEKCTYKDGKKEGLYETWHMNGQLWGRCTYKDGNIVGPYKMT